MLLCRMIRITNPIVIVVDEMAIVNMYFGLPDRKNPDDKGGRHQLSAWN
jgi:hypothetical protein